MPPSLEELPWYACLANLIEFALPRIHLLGSLLRDGASCRGLLVRASSAIHTATLLHSLGRLTKTNAMIRDRILSIKESYLQAPGTHRIVELVQLARQLLISALWDIASLVDWKGTMPSNPILKDVDRRAVTQFVRAPRRHVRSASCDVRLARSTWLQAPAGLFPYFATYAKLKGAVGNATRKAISPQGCTFRIHSELREFLGSRAAAMDRRLAFLATSSCCFSDIRPHPGYAIT